MKVSFGILVNLSLVFTALTVQAQERWALESVFIRNRLPIFIMANDFILFSSINLSDFRFFGHSEPSFQYALRDAKYNFYAEPYSNSHSEYTIGGRWLRFDSYQKGFLGPSQIEAWLTVLPSTHHYLSAQKQLSYKSVIGDTVENHLYSARLFRKQIGLGAAYSKQIFAKKRWRFFTGIQLGYQIEYGRGELREFISDAVIIAYPNDSNRLGFEGINTRSQTITIGFAPTHVFISGFQLGTEYRIHKRIQLFCLLQTQLLAIRNSESNFRFAKGFSVPASLGIRYLLKPDKIRVFG